jgi:outer membrane protein assembly factor BamE
MPRLHLLTPALLAASLLATGCESLQRTDSFLGVITPYRIDIVQGNAITKEQLAAVRPGMTQAQVREILGTPLVTDPFHAQRWDYVFTLRRDGTAPQRRSIVALFDGDVLKSITAPELPGEREFVATISRQRNVKPPKLDLTEDERRALPPPARPPVPTAEPMGPVRAYPPLEI